jgi:hypothetical protein
MATDESSDAAASRNPDNEEQILGRIVGMTEVRLQVGIDPRLHAVEVAVEGLPMPCSLLLSDRATVHFTVQLSHALGRLQGVTP